MEKITVTQNGSSVAFLNEEGKSVLILGDRRIIYSCAAMAILEDSEGLKVELASIVNESIFVRGTKELEGLDHCRSQDIQFIERHNILLIDQPATTDRMVGFIAAKISNGYVTSTAVCHSSDSYVKYVTHDDSTIVVTTEDLVPEGSTTEHKFDAATLNRIL